MPPISPIRGAGGIVPPTLQHPNHAEWVMDLDLALMMMRLGTSIVGSNMDLTPLDRDRDDTGSDGSGDDTDEDDTDEDDTDEDDTDEDDTEGGASGDDSEDSDEEDTEDSDEEDTEGSGDDTEDGSDEDGSDEDGSDEDGSDEDGSDEDGDATPEEEEDNSKADASEDDKGAGGNAADRDDDEGDINLDALRDALRNGENALMDNAEALREAIWGDESGDDSEQHEQVWRPERPDLDRVVRPRGDFATARLMREQARELASAITAQFRRKFLAARRPKPFHGVRYGRGLSERRLVDTMVEIKSGIRPTRPDYTIHKGMDTSLAIAVVGDQSGSMSGRPAHYAAMAMLALADSFESMGSPVMCCGVRDGRSSRNWEHSEGVVTDLPSGGRITYSRADWQQVTYDVFKDWHEPMRNKRVVSRFSAYKADGGTPLSDGVAFALESISERPERHRVIVVLTDGMPNNSATMRYLVRKAREAGVTVVGVGIGYGMNSVKELYPDKNVVVENIKDLPRELLTQIESIVFPRHGGQRADLEVRATG
jgi:hypothetical protein